MESSLIEVEHLEKFPVTRIGRVCDFTASGQRYQAAAVQKTQQFLKSFILHFWFFELQ